jgi:xylulokinase
VPDAAAAILGLRHDTDPRSILMATYEGAIVGLLDALETIDRCSSGIDPEAPLTLIGGGAAGEIWRRVVQRLSERAVSIPESTELVAIGAAVQAASTLRSLDPQELASRWQTARGTLLEPLPRDVETVAHHREIRQLALAALTGPRNKK